MSGVVLVDPEKLKETPEAFQEYVAEFFVEKKILGRTMLYACTVLSWDHRYTGYGSRPQGVAPSHSVDLMRFKKGLAKDQNLNEWMSKNQGQYLQTLYGIDDRSDGYSEDDD